MEGIDAECTERFVRNLLGRLAYSAWKTTSKRSRLTVVKMMS